MRHKYLLSTIAICIAGTVIYVWFFASSNSSPLHQKSQEIDESTQPTTSLPAPKISSKRNRSMQISSQSRLNEQSKQGDNKKIHEDINVKEIIEALRMELGNNNLMVNEEYIQLLMQNLIDQIGRDSHAKKSLIDSFLNEPNTEIGSRLLDLLGGIKDPEVEQMAQSLARSEDSNLMKVGLDLLGRLEMSSQETYEIAVKVLDAQKQDPETLMFAIQALPSMQLTEEQTAQSIRQLSRLADRSRDDGVRSNSLFKISELAQDEEDLQALLNALDRNRTNDDRVSAAIAIVNSKLKGDTLRLKLIDCLNDQNEIWEIRSYAADALERFTLSDQDYEVYKSFKKEQLDLVNQG